MAIKCYCMAIFCMWNDGAGNCEVKENKDIMMWCCAKYEPIYKFIISNEK